MPLELKTRKGTVQFAVDEHVRADVTAEQLAGMKTVFKKDGTVTAGNASGINDGAAGLVLATGDAVRRLGLKPLARLVAYAHAGVEPELMGLGPIPATRKVLEKAGLTVADLDVIESNEAFAAQACAVTRELGFDPEKVNPNGSGISSATRSVPPGRSSPPRPSMNCSASRAATPWPPCASAAARASP